MIEDGLSLVYVDEKSQREAIQYEDVGFLYISDEQQHVWLDGTHYIGVGPADSVEVGDLFFHSMPEKVIHKVTSIDDSDSPSGPPPGLEVEIETLYGPVLDWDETRTDRLSTDQLTGNLDDPPMGYAGPPTLLKEVTEYKHEDDSQG